MKKEDEIVNENQVLSMILSKYTLKSFENNQEKQYPTLPLYNYPEPHLDLLSPICYGSIKNQKMKLELYHEETLFYIFYTYTETPVQIDAYNLLISKGYYFSTSLKCFFTFTGKKIVDNTSRKIVIFDPFEWKKEEKSVVFDKEFIESIKESV